MPPLVWSFNLSLWTHPPGGRAVIVSGVLKAYDFIYSNVVNAYFLKSALKIFHFKVNFIKAVITEVSLS